MGQVQFFAFVLLTTFLLAHATEKSPSTNETSTKEVAINRKERLNPLSSLSGGLLNLLGGGGGGGQGSGSSSGGTSPGLSIQNGLKGIQSIQKFVSKFQNIMGHPFSFRGVSDTMATMTGLLAAVGGGYLTYVSMVALFGSLMDPQNTAYQHAYPSPPYQYAPPQHINVNGLQASASASQGYNRRQSTDSSGLYFGSHDIGKMFRSVTNFNYPEASFKLLRIKDEACKQRAVCEFEKFLAKKGVASVILKGVSKKITGMEKYLDAAYRGLANEDCSYAFSACPYSFGQMVLKSVGLS
ncbi:uncharacterized protein LOC129969254 [Argiope bruennichi]|uniref:Uncharacterized protein n=1 Tax=Argiope bruennichi TaxID=94029 RepID=A0A8T0FUE8_ARGBR|nr:uncharacterized protein LOC129969254 [Argiope bruennichi]KAF8792373.1 hypothetical protein HNY73_003976 [Argiope bruennichi]